jgi:hypothetical protein
MSDSRFLGTHRTWEDWFGMALGVAIALSPWFPTQHGQDYAGANAGAVIINAVAVGVLIFGLSQLEYIALQRWEEVAAICLGLWLIASPLVLGYHSDGMLRFIHTSLGGAVVLLATLQLWQDWDLSDGDMAQHGQ